MAAWEKGSITNLTTNFDVQGHRGARGYRPENTLAAFEYAIDLGVTTLELDVGISADGVVVVCHDPPVNAALCLDARGDRLPSSFQVWLWQLTLEEIQSFDCGSLNSDPVQFPDWQAIPGAYIPTLQQVFDLAEAKNPHIRYNIESKVTPLSPETTATPEEFAKQLVTLLVQNQLIDRAMIQSFDWRVLQQVKCLNPLIQTSALVVHRQAFSTSKGVSPSPWLAGFDGAPFAEDIAVLLQATGFVDVYSPNFETLLPESPLFIQSIAAIHQAGFALIPWTVNDRALRQRLIRLGVDGLITDFPDILLNLLRS